MNRPRTALALLLAGSLLALGACTDDPQPRMSRSPSASPTQSDSASPSDAPNPDRATQASLVRHFFEEISAAIATGDSSKFLARTTDNCRNCHVIAKNLDKAYVNGGRIEEGHWAVTSISRAGSALHGGVWNVGVKTAKEKWLNAKGRLVKIVTPDQLKFRVVVISAPGEWKIRELRIV